MTGFFSRGSLHENAIFSRQLNSLAPCGDSADRAGITWNAARRESGDTGNGDGTHALIWRGGRQRGAAGRARPVARLFGRGVADLDGRLVLSTTPIPLPSHVSATTCFAGLGWVALARGARTGCASPARLFELAPDLACDYFGSRGPWEERPCRCLPVPFVGHRSGIDWSAGLVLEPVAWPLNAWPNVLVTVVCLAGWVYVGAGWTEPV